MQKIVSVSSDIEVILPIYIDTEINTSNNATIGVSVALESEE